MIFEPGKEYKTRDGRRARVYWTGGIGEDAVHGAVFISDERGWAPWSWTASGSLVDGEEDEGDLMPPEPEKITRWVVIVTDHVGQPYLGAVKKTRELALAHTPANLSPFAIIPITFHRGEGLE